MNGFGFDKGFPCGRLRRAGENCHIYIAYRPMKLIWRISDLVQDIYKIDTANMADYEEYILN